MTIENEEAYEAYRTGFIVILITCSFVLVLFWYLVLGPSFIYRSCLKKKCPIEMTPKVMSESCICVVEAK